MSFLPVVPTYYTQPLCFPSFYPNLADFYRVNATVITILFDDSSLREFKTFGVRRGSRASRGADFGPNRLERNAMLPILDLSKLTRYRDTREVYRLDSKAISTRKR